MSTSQQKPSTSSQSKHDASSETKDNTDSQTIIKANSRKTFLKRKQMKRKIPYKTAFQISKRKPFSTSTDLGYTVVKVGPQSLKAKTRKGPVKRKQITQKSDSDTNLGYTVVKVDLKDRTPTQSSSKSKQKAYSGTKEDSNDDDECSDMELEEGDSKRSPAALGYTVVKVSPKSLKAKARQRPKAHSSSKKDLSDIDSDDGEVDSSPTATGYTVVKVAPKSSKAKVMNKLLMKAKQKLETREYDEDLSDMNSEDEGSKTTTGLGYTVVKVGPKGLKTKTSKLPIKKSKQKLESSEYDEELSDMDSEDGDSKTTSTGLGYTVVKVGPKSSKTKATKSPNKKSKQKLLTSEYDEDLSDMDSEEEQEKTSTGLGYTVVKVDPKGSKSKATKSPNKKLKQKLEANEYDKDLSDMDSEEEQKKTSTGLGYTVVKVGPKGSKSKATKSPNKKSKQKLEANEYDEALSDMDSEEEQKKTSTNLGYTVVTVGPKSFKSKATKSPIKKSKQKLEVSEYDEDLSDMDSEDGDTTAALDYTVVKVNPVKSSKSIKTPTKKGKLQQEAPSGILNTSYEYSDSSEEKETSITNSVDLNYTVLKASTSKPIKSPKKKSFSPNTKHEEKLDDNIDDDSEGDEESSSTVDLPDYAGTFGIEEIKIDRFHLSASHTNIQYVVIDEICLEGLDGITLEALWTRISITIKQPLPFPDYINLYLWNIITSRNDIEFYLLEEPREKLIPYDRYENSEPDLGAAIDPIDAPLDIYPYEPVKEKDVLGSASSYGTRINISDQVRQLTLHEAESNYGMKLIMVGKQRMRLKALTMSLTDPNIELAPAQYCLLERIGRSRTFGEITQGKVSLQTISRDPKIVFYNRKILIENKLITKQSFFMKTNPIHHTTGSLLHLTRFYNEKKSKTQIMTEQIVDVLRKRPFNRMEHTEAKKVFGKPNTLKKLFKLAEFQKFIRTDVQCKYRELYPNADIRQWKQKASDKEKRIRTIELINPNVNVAGSWNEDDVKEESSDEEETKQMIYNSPVLHQIYNYIRSAGPDGRSLKEIQSNKGMDFYSVRAAVNRLVNFNLIVGVKIDRGRQRLMIYQTLDFQEQDPVEYLCNTTLDQDEDELENEAIGFLSELLEVAPEYLQPSPSITEITDNTAITETEGNTSYELIKKLRQENKPIKGKNIGYSSKAGESLHSQFVTQQEKLKLESASGFIDDSIVVEDTADVQTVDSRRNASNSLILEKIFKNRHKYEASKNTLNLQSDNSVEKNDLQEICREICNINASNRKIKRKKKIRKRLYSKLQQTDIKQVDSPKNYVCPLKLPSFDNRYLKLCHKVLKAVQPILSHFKYKVNIFEPKKTYMCRQKMTKEDILKFSVDHPLIPTDLTSLDTTIVDRFDSTSLKRKAETAVEEVNIKRMKLDGSFLNEETTVDTVGCFMGPKPRIEYHAIDKDNIEITVYVSTAPEEFDESGYRYIKDNNATLRTLKRASCIVEAVRQEKIITDVRRLRKMIESNDNDEGYNVKVDRKSIDRIYTRLVKSGHIKIVQIILKSLEIKRSIMIVCDPSVDIRHTVMESVIEQMKMRFFVAAMRRDWENTQTIKSVPIVEKPLTAFDTSEITSSVGELKLLSINDSQYLYNRNIGKTYGYAPKFMRMRLLHEFLFYLIYDYRNEDVGDAREILSEVDVDEDIFEELPQLYNKEVGWRMFVPSLPQHGGWHEGWALVCDVLLRLPLSLFAKLYNISFVIPELPGYLEHPVKQHYLVRQLPSDIRNGLLHRRKYIFSIHETIARLCYIGIIQFGPQKLREKDQLFIFLNRRATLLDTTTSIPGYHYVEDKEYKKIDHYFATSKDVETYWYEMWNICAHSKLGLRNAVTGTYITIEQVDTKPAMVAAMKLKTPETALRDDNGTVPGDKRGAGGLDSALWAHIKRNWMWCSQLRKPHEKPNPARPGFTTIIKKKPKEKKQTPKQIKLIKTNKTANLDPVTESHRRTYKNINVTVVKKPRVVEQISRGKSYIRKVLPRADLKKKKDYDPIDQELMANLKQSRSEWKEEENRILHICKIVATFLCPNMRKHCISYTVIRDVLHKLSPSSLNKTSGACQRRLLVTFGTTDQLDFLIQFSKTLRLIPFVKKYFHKFLDERAGLLKSTSEKELNSIFVLLVTHFYKHQNELSHVFNAIAYKYQIETNYKTKDETNLEIVTTEEEVLFENDSSMEIVSYDYAEIVDEKVKQNRLYNEFLEFPKTETDIILETIKSIIHSTIGSRQEDMSWIYQLFKVYQNYPDELLKTALNDIRNSQMVSIKRAFTRRHSEVEGLPITTKLFQFSFYYCFTQITKFPPELFGEAHEILLGIAKHHESLTDTSEIGLPMECFEQGHSVGLSELAVNIKSYFNIDIPKEVLLLNPKIADHTELIRELATRYKKMLTLVKQGTYFKDDDDSSEFSLHIEEQVDSTKHEKAKIIPRTPMIQRFLKSWFLADEPPDSLEDPEDSDPPKEDSNPLNVKTEEGEKKPILKPKEKRKYPNVITSEETKKILESLNPNLYSEKLTEKLTKKKTEFPNPFGGNDLTFEDYEKKLESLLSSKTPIDESSETVQENPPNFEDAEADPLIGLSDFSENENVLEKYLHTKRHSIAKPTVSSENFTKAYETLIEIDSMSTENVDSDPVTNARMQYLMDDELTVEQIMEEMLVDCPLEERKVPRPINLARLLVKGLFPELDEDEERLERLHQHFVIICPDTNLTLADVGENEEFNYLYMQHSQTCKSLLRKVQMDIIISDNFLPHSELISRLKILGATNSDIEISEELIDFVLKKRVLGASTKELKEHFSNRLETIKLSTLLIVIASTNVLIRTGINYLVYVHHKFRKHWLVESCTLADRDRLKLTETNTEDSSDLPILAKSFESYTEMKLRIMPWARIDGTVNLKVFEKWMSTVLGYCLSDTLTPLVGIIRSCYYLKPIDVFYLVESLQELGCVQMLLYKPEKTTLFSSPEYLEPVPAEITDEFGKIYIDSDHTAVIKLGALLNKKMKEFDFPSDEAKKHGTF